MKEVKNDYAPPDLHDIYGSLCGDQEAVMNIYLHYEGLFLFRLKKYIGGFAARANLEISSYPM